MSHFVAYILQFQEIIVYKIPPWGGGGSIASLRSKSKYQDITTVTEQQVFILVTVFTFVTV